MDCGHHRPRPESVERAMHHGDGRSVSECQENQTKPASWAWSCLDSCAGRDENGRWASAYLRNAAYFQSASNWSHPGNVSWYQRGENDGVIRGMSAERQMLIVDDALKLELGFTAKHYLWDFIDSFHCNPAALCYQRVHDETGWVLTKADSRDVHATNASVLFKSIPNPDKTFVTGFNVHRPSKGIFDFGEDFALDAYEDQIGSMLAIQVALVGASFKRALLAADLLDKEKLRLDAMSARVDALQTASHSTTSQGLTLALNGFQKTPVAGQTLTALPSSTQTFAALTLKMHSVRLALTLSSQVRRRC
jgi:hypothetical protein